MENLTNLTELESRVIKVMTEREMITLKDGIMVFDLCDMMYSSDIEENLTEKQLRGILSSLLKKKLIKWGNLPCKNGAWKNSAKWFYLAK